MNAIWINRRAKGKCFHVFPNNKQFTSLRGIKMAAEAQKIGVKWWDECEKKKKEAAGNDINYKCERNTKKKIDWAMHGFAAAAAAAAVAAKVYLSALSFKCIF